MIEYGRTLYYPTIKIRNTNWFKLSTLLYDGIDRIVPKNINCNDNYQVKELNDSLGYIRNINPQKYAKKTSEKFVTYFKENVLNLEKDEIDKIISFDDEEHFKIHNDKLEHKLMHTFQNLIIEKNGDHWHNFSPILGLTYMTFLANEIATDKDLPLVTDYNKNQTILNNTQINSVEEKNDVAFNLASLAIKSYLPKNIASVSVKQIIKFREKHDSERRRFYSAINDLVKDLDKTTNKDTLEDILNYRKKDIDSSVNDLRLSLKGLGIDVKEALLGISLPSALQLIPSNVPSETEIKVAGAAAMLYVLGAKSIYNKRKIKLDSPFSYLLSMEQSKLGHQNLLKQLVKGKVIL